MTFAGICLKLIFTKPFEDNTWIFFLISNNFFNVEKRSAHCHLHNSSVIRQKGESHNGCFKKTKHVKFTEKRTFFTLWYAHVWNLWKDLETPVLRFVFLPYYHFLHPDTHTHVCLSVGKKCSFFGKIGVLCFLETPALRFTLLTSYRGIGNIVMIHYEK